MDPAGLRTSGSYAGVAKVSPVVARRAATVVVAPAVPLPPCSTCARYAGPLVPALAKTGDAYATATAADGGPSTATAPAKRASVGRRPVGLGLDATVVLEVAPAVSLAEVTSAEVREAPHANPTSAPADLNAAVPNVPSARPGNATLALPILPVAVRLGVGGVLVVADRRRVVRPIGVVSAKA